jgi:hypothetical protein
LEEGLVSKSNCSSAQVFAKLGGALERFNPWRNWVMFPLVLISLLWRMPRTDLELTKNKLFQMPAAAQLILHSECRLQHFPGGHGSWGDFGD